MADKTDRQIALYAAIESISTYETEPADIPGRVLPVADAFYAWLTANPRQPDGAPHPATPAEGEDCVHVCEHSYESECANQPRPCRIQEELDREPVDRKALERIVLDEFAGQGGLGSRVLEDGARNIADAVLTVLAGGQEQVER